MASYPVEDAGTDWKVVVNDRVAVENVVNWNSSQANKPSGYRAGLGVDPTTSTTKLAFLLFPKSEWDISDLMDPIYQSQLERMAGKCNVCATLDAMRENEPDTTTPVMQNEIAMIPSSAPRQMSAGDVVAPKYLTKMIEIGQSMFCTPLGKVGVSTLGSIMFDVMSGWSSDPGQKAAMKQISDELVSMNITPEEMPAIKDDALRMYKAWQKDGEAVGAVKTGFFKQFDTAIKEGIGVEVNEEKTTRKRTTIGIRKGVCNMAE